MRRAQQSAVEPVGPAVVPALNPTCETALRGCTQARAPVTADVVKGFDQAGIAADHDNTLAGDLAQEVIARIGNAIGASCADPTLKKEVLQLVAKERGVCIVARRQCFRDGAQRCLLNVKPPGAGHARALSAGRTRHHDRTGSRRLFAPDTKAVNGNINYQCGSATAI